MPEKMNEQLREIVAWLFGGEHDYKVPFCGMKWNGKRLVPVKCSALDDFDSIAEFLKEEEYMNYYWGPSFINHATGKMGRHVEADVEAMSCIWCDVASPCSDEELSERLVQNPNIPDPSLVIRTGRSFHLYWKFDRIFRFKEDGVHKDSFKKVMRELSILIGGDKTHDLSRLMRVPNTKYYKDVDDVLLVRDIEVFDFNKKEYPWERFREFEYSQIKEKIESKNHEYTLASLMHRETESAISKYKRENNLLDEIRKRGGIQDGQPSGNNHRFWCPMCQVPGHNRGGFVANAENGMWYCHHGSHEGRNNGDVIEFIKQMDGKAVREIIASSLTAASRSKSESAPTTESAIPARPKIMLPGLNKSIAAFASELARALKPNDIFCMNDFIIYSEGGGKYRPIQSNYFRTLADKYVDLYVYDKKGNEVYKSMSRDIADAVIVSEFFRKGIRSVKRINNCRMPVMRSDGSVELLEEGYDSESEILTINQIEYPDDMTVENAKSILEDLFSEFNFDGSNRVELQRNTAIGAMLGLFAQGLLPEFSLRPCFIIDANAEGAGKTMLAQTMIVPVVGMVEITSGLKDDDELRKILVASIKEDAKTLLFDNVRGRIQSEVLEGFVSAPTYKGRILGSTATFSASNNISIFITTNNCTVNPDMARRSLFIQLHMSKARASELQYNRSLDIATLLSYRPAVLGALWALVKNWATSRHVSEAVNPGFPQWSKLIGGIAEYSGFPFAVVQTHRQAADVEYDNMLALVSHINERYSGSAEFSFSEVITMCKEIEAFEYLVGKYELSKSEKALLGFIFKKYDRRNIGDRVLEISGSGHYKKFKFRKAI